MKIVKCFKCSKVSEHPIDWGAFVPKKGGKVFFLCPECTKEDCEVIEINSKDNPKQ